MYYFAYNEYISREKMRNICPSAMYFYKGVLKDFKLVFQDNGYGKPMPNILKCKGATVEGTIWIITPRDLRLLDMYQKNPNVTRDKFEVYMEELESGTLCICNVYSISSITYFVYPAKAYIKIMKDAYASMGLNMYKLLNALKITQIEAKTDTNKDIRKIVLKNRFEEKEARIQYWSKNLRVRRQYVKLYTEDKESLY